MYSHDPRVTKCEEIPVEFPPQYQPGQPGLEYLMLPRPVSELPGEVGSGKLQNKVAIITGGTAESVGRSPIYLLEKGRISLSYTSMNTLMPWRLRRESGN